MLWRVHNSILEEEEEGIGLQAWAEDLQRARCK